MSVSLMVRVFFSRALHTMLFEIFLRLWYFVMDSFHLTITFLIGEKRGLICQYLC